MQSDDDRQEKKKQTARFPAIAPKDDQASTPSSSSGQEVSVPHLLASNSSRARLPPRSKTGCWTCRARKVKCDEGRPACGPCSRLGHECDYSPRLFFRDDTPRVVERMQDMSSQGESPVWNPNSQAPRENTTTSAEDTLPPFAALTNDEDRERKAELQQPGTFHVVVNPSSFAALPEYAGESELVGPTGSDWTLVPRQSNETLPQQPAGHLTLNDPNVVILNTFEDSSSRPPISQEGNAQYGPQSTSHSSAPSPADVSHQVHTLSLSNEPSRAQLPIENPPQNSRDTRSLVNSLFVHYRTFVKPRLNQFYRTGASGGGLEDFLDPFEEQSRRCRPAFHSLMALSGLSQSQRRGGSFHGALHLYQHALRLVHSHFGTSQNFLSDGSLITHILIALFEIASQQWNPALWAQRAAQLLNIIFGRRNSQIRETYPHLIWWVCMIDIFVVLGGSGSGEFMQAMISSNLLPPALSTLPPRSAINSGPLFPEEQSFFLPILQLNRDLVLLASQLGQMGRQMRAEAIQLFYVQNTMIPLLPAAVVNQRGNLATLQAALRHTWENVTRGRIPANWLIDDCGLPPRVEGVLKQACALYRLCLIYSHTSMWPSQREQLTEENEREIAQSVSEILRVAQTVVAEGRFTYRFIVFPLFIAGVATNNQREKTLALELIIAMERESIGVNTRATRHLLQLVYSRQNAGLMTVGHALHVDWIQVMFESGVQILHVGL